MEDARNDSRRRRPEQWVMYGAGMLLLAGGLFHVLVWIVDGGTLSGPVSWRKPILFGFSAGATVLSLGWLVGKFPRFRGDLPLLTAFSLAMLIEVGLITLQQWRGVPSHFNRSTPFDAAVSGGIEWLIIFATLVIAELTRRSFQPLRTTSDMALAIRGGMALLLFSCLLGFVLVAHGNQQLQLGRPPGIFGQSGVLKFPHGAAMHAIQFLPVGAWLLRVLRVPSPARLYAVGCALGSILFFAVFSLLQTFSGRARFEWWWFSSPLLLLAALLLVPPLFVAIRHAVQKVS